MNEFECYADTQIKARPFSNDHSVERWIEKQGIQCLSYGERGMLLYGSQFQTPDALSPQSDTVFLTDLDGIMYQTNGQLKALAEKFLSEPDEAETNKLYDTMRLLLKARDPLYRMSQSERSELDGKRGYIQLYGVFFPKFLDYLGKKYEGSNKTNAQLLRTAKKEIRQFYRVGTMNMEESVSVSSDSWNPPLFEHMLDEVEIVSQTINSPAVALSYNGKVEGAEKAIPLLQKGIISAAIIFPVRKHIGLQWLINHPSHDMTRELQMLGIERGRSLLYQSENSRDLVSILDVLSPIMECRGLLVQNEGEWFPDDPKHSGLQTGILPIAFIKGSQLNGNFSQTITKFLRSPSYNTNTVI